MDLASSPAECRHWCRLLPSMSVIRELQQAFLRGYDPHFNCHNAMFEALRLQHVMTHLHRLHQLDRLPLYEHRYKRRICRDHERWIVQ